MEQLLSCFIELPSYCGKHCQLYDELRLAARLASHTPALEALDPYKQPIHPSSASLHGAHCVLSTFAIGIHLFTQLVLLKNTKKFNDDKKRRPNEDSKDDYEKRLGSWVTAQGIKYRKNIEIFKNDKIKQLWEEYIKDEKYKIYFLTKDDLWLDNLYKSEEYIKSKKYRPKKTDDLYTSWININVQQYNKGLLIEPRKSKWEKFIKDEWYILLELYKLFLISKKLRPSFKSKDDKEKALTSWKNTSTTNYKKKVGLMKDDIIRQKWDEFITDEKYRQYFQK
jgi:hypothetical protein